MKPHPLPAFVILGSNLPDGPPRFTTEEIDPVTVYTVNGPLVLIQKLMQAGASSRAALLTAALVQRYLEDGPPNPDLDHLLSCDTVILE